MRTWILAVACISCFGCGPVQAPIDAVPEASAEAAADVSSVDAVDVPIAMDVVDIAPNDVACSPACFFFEECVAGRCVTRPDVIDIADSPRCNPMQRECAFDSDAGSACYDLQTSWERCGDCETQCAFDTAAMMRGVCAGGRCVCRDSAFTACPVAGAGVIRTIMLCANTSNDPMHCGTCGNRCAPSAPRCVAGRCVS